MLFCINFGAGGVEIGMEIGLVEALDMISRRTDLKSLHIPSGFVTPGGWVIFASIALKEKVSSDEIHFPSINLQGYSSAIGFNHCVYGKDDYQFSRKNAGKKYSPLTRLDCLDATDTATDQIVSCIREMLSDPDASGAQDLFNVIGELHDNVWSHGLSTGVSMAQKWDNTGRPAVEFALADTGLGFLRELRRCGRNVDDDIEAIKWCVVKNNSTKHADEDDFWAQAFPDDVMGGVPFGDVVPRTKSKVNHQGLGLWKLTELIKTYRGRLTLVSGCGRMTLNPDGETVYNVGPHWKGVAISCRLYEDELYRELSEPDEQVSAIMKRLGG